MNIKQWYGDMVKWKILLMVLCFLGVYTANSQVLEVVDFKEIAGSPLAIRYPVRDVKHDLCALVRIVLPTTENVVFTEAIKKEYKTETKEWWVYLTKGTKWLTIKIPQYPSLRYDFDIPIESKKTYEMTIRTNTIKNSSALLRSAFLPGWGQFYKSRNGRGTLIIIGETLSLAAGGLSLYNELTQKSIMDKPEVGYQDYMAAKDGYEQWNTARHISFITAAVIYGLNLVDAYLTPTKSQNNIVFTPNVMNANGEMAFGTTLSIKF